MPKGERPLCSIVASEIQTTDGIAKAVLMNLASHANARTLRCWPSIALLAKETEFSARTVERAIARLEAAGLLLVKRPTGRTSTYTLTLPPSDSRHRQSDAPVRESVDPRQRVAYPRQRVAQKSNGRASEEPDVPEPRGGKISSGSPNATPSGTAREPGADSGMGPNGYPASWDEEEG